MVQNEPPGPEGELALHPACCMSLEVIKRLGAGRGNRGTARQVQEERGELRRVHYLSRGFGWRIHCGVKVSESSTNKQHTLHGWWGRKPKQTVFSNFRPLRTYFEEEAATSTTSAIHQRKALVSTRCA